MNVELNEDQLAIRESVREFAQGVVAPRAADIDKSADFPRDLVAKCGEMGYLGVGVPEEPHSKGCFCCIYPGEVCVSCNRCRLHVFCL